jgi:hypothetical protein
MSRRISVQGIPEYHSHKGFSIAIGDAKELLKVGSDGEPIYFTPWLHNPFEKGNLDIEAEDVARGAFNGDGMVVVDGQTGMVVASGLIVLSMKGGGADGGGRHKSSRALSKQPPQGCVVIKCSEDEKGSKFNFLNVFYNGNEFRITREDLEQALDSKPPVASSDTSKVKICHSLLSSQLVNC